MYKVVVSSVLINEIKIGGGGDRKNIIRKWKDCMKNTLDEL